MIDHIRAPGRVLLIALLLGLSFNAFFLFHPLGLSVPLYTLLVLTGLVWLSQREKRLGTKRHRWLYLPLLFFAFMVPLRANLFLTFLNLCALIGLFSFVAYFYTGKRILDLRLIDYAVIPLIAAGNALSHSFPLISRSLVALLARQKEQPRLVPIARGLLLATPILIFFTILLASADLIFADWLRRIFTFTDSTTFWELVARVSTILIVTAFWAGGYAYALRRQDDDPAGQEATDSPIDERQEATIELGFVESTVILISVNLLFIAFGLVQFAYLFGGLTYLNIENFSYATYARQGFFELVTVSVLTLVLILGLNWVTRRENKGQLRQFNGLSSLMVVLVLVLLSSAFYRLWLYETAFGFTELRLYSHVFMGWLAALFVWFLLTVWKRAHYFTVGIFVAIIGFIVTLNLINPDAFITRHNINRFVAMGEMAVLDLAGDESDRLVVEGTGRGTSLDTTYLANLSNDAIPELLSRLDDLPNDQQEALRERLADRLERLEARFTEEAAWQSFHFSHWRAYQRLLALDL